MASIPQSANGRRVAVVLCILPALYFAATATYALANFGAYASDTPQFLRYVAGPIAIAALFVICGIRLSDGAAAMIGASAIAVLAGLFLFELVLSVRLFGVMAGMFGATNGSEQVARFVGSLPPGATVKGLNRDLGTATLKDAILGGIPHRPVLLCARDGEPIVYVADRYGFNNPDSVYRSNIDMMVIGDSFVEGHCLPPGRDLVSRIRATHPATVGIGMRGAGPLAELARLGRFGPVLRPPVVVIAFFEGNDWDNLKVELDMPWLRAALEPDADFGSLAPAPETVHRAEAIFRDWDGMTTSSVEDVFERTRFVRNFFALHQTALQLGLSYPQVPPPQPVYRDVLRRAKELTNEWGGEIVLVYIPRTDRFHGLLPQDFAFDRLRGYVRSAAADADIRVVDLTTIFRQQADPRGLYAPDSHLSERGTAVAAQAILDAIGPGKRDQIAGRISQP